MYKNYEVLQWIFANVLARAKIILNSASGIEFNGCGKGTDVPRRASLSFNEDVPQLQLRFAHPIIELSM